MPKIKGYCPVCGFIVVSSLSHRKPNREKPALFEWYRINEIFYCPICESLVVRPHLLGGTPIIIPKFWHVVKQSNPYARALANRHYSRKHPGSNNFIGPGESLVLLTYDNSAVFGWYKPKYRYDSQNGIECSLFRNEGSILSSELIKEAEWFAYSKWGSCRLFTYVNPNKVRSPNPGACFQIAGWKKSKKKSECNNLILFEKEIG